MTWVRIALNDLWGPVPFAEEDDPPGISVETGWTSSLAGVDIIRCWQQQCPEGRDDQIGSFVHYRHTWTHPSGKTRWCRGWFPSLSTARGGIRYERTT